MRKTRQRIAYLIGLALCIATLTGCPVKLVSNYDETIDKEATALHKKLDEFFVTLPNKAREEREFRHNQAFYEEVLVDLSSLQVRAEGIHKNRLTIEQLELVETNIGYLTLLHKGCVTGPLTKNQKEKVKQNGVDVSMDCKAAHGASENVSDRGASVLNPAIVGNLRRQLGQQLGAVMALELAKKRGEEQD